MVGFASCKLLTNLCMCNILQTVTALYVLLCCSTLNLMLLWQTNRHLFNGLFSWTTWVSCTTKVKPIWILMKQWWGGNDSNWTTYKSFAHRSRQITLPAPNHSIFYSPDVRKTTGWRPTKSILGYPPHLKYVAALLWKTLKNQKFCTFHARKTRFRCDFLSSTVSNRYLSCVMK